MRWGERRVENDLLKRELLLRLRAEYAGSPGRSRPASSDFRRQVRRLLLAHPFFAVEYRLLAIKLGVERFQSRERKRTSRPRQAHLELIRAYAFRLRHEPLHDRTRTLAGASVAVAAATAIAVLAAYDLGAFGYSRARPAAEPRPARPISDQAPHRLHAGAAAFPPPHAAKHETQPAGRPTPHLQPTATQRPALVSYRLRTTAPSAVSGGDPAPLPARRSAPRPTPLKAP